MFSPTQRLFEPVVTLPSLVKERKAEAEKDGQQTEQTQTQVQESQDGYKPGKLTSAASASQSAQMGCNECKGVLEALANSVIAAQKRRAITWELKPVSSFSTSGRRLPSFLTPTCTSCIRWGLIHLLPILNSGEI